MHRFQHLLACSVFAAIPAFAQSYPDAPAQNATIQLALSAAPTGSVVPIAAGTYTGSGNRDLTPPSRAITIRGAGSAATILDVQGTPANPHRGFQITAGVNRLVIGQLTITKSWSGVSFDSGQSRDPQQSLPLGSGRSDSRKAQRSRTC